MTDLRKPTFTEGREGFSDFGRQAEGHFRADRPVDIAVFDVNHQNWIAIKIAIGPDIGAFETVRCQAVAENLLDRLLYLALNILFLSHAANIIDDVDLRHWKGK
jgi:hypothetical protein